MHRKRQATRLALITCFGLTVAGCAHSPSSAPRRGSPPGVVKAPPSQDAAPVESSATDPDSRVREWRDPEQDLWARARSGFALAAHTDRRPVREWTHYYATHRNLLDATLARARPFLWHIVAAIESRDLPGELALLPLIESGYDPSAESYVGASGLWQFMPATARDMGLTQDWWYDARNDVTSSTQAALDYLELLCQRYDGDWLLALAAYNAGPGRVDEALERAAAEGIRPVYWNLDLPLETTEYVPKLLAVRRILSAPSRFGVDWPTLDNERRTATVELPSQTEIAVAADMLDMPEAALRELNPGMRRWASGPQEAHHLLVPVNKVRVFRQRLAQADPSDLVRQRTHTVHRGDILSRIAERYGVSVASLRQANHLRSNRIIVGQTLQIPRPAGGVPKQPTQTYTVQAGDSFWTIARRYKVALARLRRANDDADATIQPGQKLVIPAGASAPEPTTYVVQAGDSLWSIADANDIAVAELKRWNRVSGDETLQPGRTLAIDGAAPLPDFYQVESGDSLWSIADRFSMRVATLRSLNDMSTSSTIRPGQRLRLQPAVSG